MLKAAVAVITLNDIRETNMAEIKDIYQSGDWKNEKHVPVIDAPESVAKGEFFRINATIGKEIAHPNTTEHHIRWIQLFFKPEGAKFAFEVGRGEFSAHGESPEGPNTSTVYTNHEVTLGFKTDKPGTIIATSYCNIHGFWSSSKELKVG